jgi:hypothetical protein
MSLFKGKDGEIYLATRTVIDDAGVDLMYWGWRDGHHVYWVREIKTEAAYRRVRKNYLTSVKPRL